MRIATLSSGFDIGETEIDQLRTSLRGPLLLPDDRGYNEARTIFNGMFDPRPAIITRCRGMADVVHVVQFAAPHSLLTAIRARGHSVAGNSTCDGGLVIDLSEMNGVVVDRARQTVRVQCGATWRDVDRETQVLGLATPGGIVSHTGAGLALNGGIGWLRNKYGLTCDNLVSAELVTAAGEVVTANASENADLLWALKGGGGNFGVVTSFEFALHPVGPLVAVVFSIYPISSTRSVLRKWRDWLAFAPDDASTEILTWTAPAGSSLPALVHEPEIVIAAGSIRRRCRGFAVPAVESGYRRLTPWSRCRRRSRTIAPISGHANAGRQDRWCGYKRGYSSRNATTGSTVAARREGT